MVLWFQHLCKYRIIMFAKWKFRQMYATCMWLVQLLLMFNKHDYLFNYFKVLC
jgi:Kip1 ubiquitination-promoting complex protein 1